MGVFLKFYINNEGMLKYDKVKVKGKIISGDELQESVGNWFQYIYHVDLGDNNLALVADEEGIYRGLIDTFWLYDKESRYVFPHPIVGNVLVVRTQGANTVCLSNSDINKVLNKIMFDLDTRKYFLPIDKNYIRNQREFFNSMGFK